MNVEEIREYCLGLPCVTEDMAFGEDYLLLRVCGKIFACIGLVRTDYFVVKCDAEYALDLRDRYEDVEPAWHWNKKYWNQIRVNGSLGDELVKSLIRHSYSEVVKKMPRKEKAAHPEVEEVRAD